MGGREQQQQTQYQAVLSLSADGVDSQRRRLLHRISSCCLSLTGSVFEATLEPGGYSFLFFLFLSSTSFLRIPNRGNKKKGATGVPMFSLHEGSGLLLLSLLAGLQ
ncbi:hypothetical protein XENORESO_014865, partial [Xenotaenia resolanae]